MIKTAILLVMVGLARASDKPADLIERCVQEVPWDGMIKDPNSHEQQKEFCEAWQFEAQSNPTFKKAQDKLNEIFGVAKRVRHRPLKPTAPVRSRPPEPEHKPKTYHYRDDGP